MVRSKKAGISYVDYYIPEKELRIEDLLSKFDDKDLPVNFKSKEDYLNFSKSILQLDSIRILEDTTEEDILSTLLEKLFTEKINPEAIDIIININEPEYSNNSNIINYLKFKFKITNAYILNISGNYCANLDVAIDVAQKLLESNTSINNILLIGSVKIKNIKSRIFGSFAVLGDGAGIVLIDRNPKIIMSDNVILSNHNLYNMKIDDDNTLLHYKFVNSCLKKIIQKNTLENEAIEKIIIQNTNSLLVDNAIIANKLDSNIVYRENNSKYGHIAFLDIMINLWDMYLKEKNSNAISITLGFKGSYISSLYKFLR